MLTFPLKKIWYNKIKNSEKSIEYRVAKEYWLRRTINAYFENADRDNELFQSMNDLWDLGAWSEAEELFISECSKGLKTDIPCILRMGYTKQTISANICEIQWLQSGKDTDLEDDRPVFAFKLENVKEN